MTAKRMWGSVGVDELEEAFGAWPGSLYEKGRLWTFLLRVRVEAVVSALPATVVSSVGSSERLERKLLLSVGEPGLDKSAQKRRLGIVEAAAAAYEQMCDMLHGADPHPYPPLAELKVWSRIVDELEREFSRNQT